VPGPDSGDLALTSDQAMPADPLIDGITAAVVGVGDPGPHLALYRDRLGFGVVADGVLPGATAAALWRCDPVDRPLTVLAAAGAPGGRIVLLGVPDTAAGAQHPRVSDVGMGALDLYTRDIDATHRELTDAGHAWLSPPATYQVPVGDTEVTVTEGLCLAPDGTDLVFVQPAKPRGTAAWDADPNRRYTELTSVGCHVPDIEAEVAFWGPGGLGLDQWYDVTFSADGLDTMAALRPGTRLRLVFLAGASTARLELNTIENRAADVDRRERQRTGRALGHSGWLVATTCCSDPGARRRWTRRTDCRSRSSEGTTEPHTAGDRDRNADRPGRRRPGHGAGQLRAG
jgi:hypothetical protein